MNGCTNHGQCVCTRQKIITTTNFEIGNYNACINHNTPRKETVIPLAADIEMKMITDGIEQ